jgi:hypothetical protein
MVPGTGLEVLPGSLNSKSRSVSCGTAATRNRSGGCTVGAGSTGFRGKRLGTSDVDGPGMLYQFGGCAALGFTCLPPHRTDAVFCGRLNTYKSEPGNPFCRQRRSWFGSAGLDAKIGLSATSQPISPSADFGQVESDPSVMNLTALRRSARQRPFFLEGKAIFDFECDDASLFYSRRIGHAPSFAPSLGSNEYLDLRTRPRY